MKNQIAKTFLSRGIQHWGQSDVERAKATDAYLEAAGFDLKAQAKEAGDWLNGVMDSMPWGKFENEADHLSAALEKRALLARK